MQKRKRQNNQAAPPRAADLQPTVEELIAEAVRKCLRTSGLTQIQVAAKMKVTQAYIAKLASGRGTIKSLHRLARVCGCRVRRIEIEPDQN